MLKLGQAIQVLIGDPGQGHSGDVELLPLDEAQEEIEGAFEGRQLNLVESHGDADDYNTKGGSSKTFLAYASWYNSRSVSPGA